VSNAVLAHSWEVEGERLGEGCDAITSAVVIGNDPEAAGALALGIARVQGQRRRVAIGDLAGGDNLLQELAMSDDIHGLVDSFLYGVSLTHIARPLAGHPNVFILPYGSEQASEEILRHPRWRRLTAGFREVEALLLLVVRAGAAGLEALVPATDGVILADADRADVPGPVVAAAKRPPVDSVSQGSQHDVAAAPLTAPVEEVRELAPPAAAAVEPELGWPYVERRQGSRHGALRRVLPALAIAAALIAVGAGGVWLGRVLTQRDADVASALAAARHQDSAAAVVAQATGPPVENPADSASASAYAIEVVVANTEAGATSSLTNEQRSLLPATTVGPVLFPGDTARWFRVVVGATPDFATADSLLASLRASHRFAVDAGKIVRVPLALLVDRDVAPDSARARARALRLIGIPAYALAQLDGTARVYAGAFESADQTALLAQQLRSAGLAPAVVYRTGRPL
jgi:hypothetical protein